MTGLHDGAAVGASADGDLARALEDHFRVQVIAYGHATPRGAVHVSDHAVLAHTGLPSIYNRGTALHLDQPDIALGEVDRFFDGLPHALWLRAADVDGDRDALLRGRGYVPLSGVSGMARLLPADELPVRDDHRTTLVTDPWAAADVAAVATDGFGFGPEDRLVIEDVTRYILRHGRPFHHGAVYAVGGGEGIVSVGLLLATAEMAGLSTIATVASHRRQGLATAVVSRALHDAAALGWRQTGVVTNPDSRALFDGLGFREVNSYVVYRQRRREGQA